MSPHFNVGQKVYLVPHWILDEPREHSVTNISAIDSGWVAFENGVRVPRDLVGVVMYSSLQSLGSERMRLRLAEKLTTATHDWASTALFDDLASEAGRFGVEITDEDRDWRQFVPDEFKADI